MKVGFIGLGSMGQPMARNLLKAGHELAAYNRTRSRSEALRPDGAHVADTPAQAAHGAEVVVTMLADDAAVKHVLFAEDPAGFASALPHGAVHVSMSTISVELSRSLARAHAARGQRYVAAPVFGRPEAADAARLSVVAAGAGDAVEACKPLFEAVGQALYYVGDQPEMANVVKIAGNFTIAAMMETLGEAYALLRKHDIDPKQFLEIVNGGLFKSPVYQNYGAIIADKRFEPAGFKLKLGLKDARLALAAADAAAVPMPLASLIHDHFLSALAQGHGDADWSAITQVIAESAGLE